MATGTDLGPLSAQTSMLQMSEDHDAGLEVLQDRY